LQEIEGKYHTKRLRNWRRKDRDHATGEEVVCGKQKKGCERSCQATISKDAHVARTKKPTSRSRVVRREVARWVRKWLKRKGKASGKRSAIQIGRNTNFGEKKNPIAARRGHQYRKCIRSRSRKKSDPNGMIEGRVSDGLR